MSTTSTVGIDLGTTFSCVSVYRNGRAEVIPNSDADRLIPSIVYYNPKTGKVYVGQTANVLLPQHPNNGLLDAKRFIGRKYDDEFISRYKNSNEVHFTLVRGEDEQAAFEIDIGDTKVIKKPEEVSAEVLKHLKEVANEYLGECVTKAVISVPAYFSNAQRKATKRAAELAGFDVMKLITEPTAAAIYYVSDKHRKNSNILAFDLGGGTLDVSLIKVNNNVFEVKAVYGDTLLGGRDFDEMMFEHFYKDFLNVNNENFANRKFKRRLSSMCADLKKKLSTFEEFTLYLDRYDGNTDLNIHMTRKTFEEINQEFFKRIMDIVELSLYDSGLKKSDIEEVILIGGSTRIPKIRQLLSSYFGNKKIKTDLIPDEAVAAGASIHAALLLGQCQDLEKYKVTEVTPMSLGTSKRGNLMSILIPKNSKLPARGFEDTETCHNDQKIVTFQIYEGERSNVIYNNKLGEFSIEDLPKKRAGDVHFTKEFILDEDGILTVTAKEESTGKSNSLVVTMGQFRLSDRKIRLSVEDARKHKEEDDTFNKFIRRRNNLYTKCQHVLYDINKISSDVDRETVRTGCENFLTDGDKINFRNIGELEERFMLFYNSVSDILKTYSLLSLID